MVDDTFSEGAIYSFDVENGELQISIFGRGDFVEIIAWDRMKSAFSEQLKLILERNQIDRIVFTGDKFGKNISTMCKVDLRDLLKGKVDKKFIERSRNMKFIYIEDAIFCQDRFAVHCDFGLNIEIDAPVGSDLIAKKESGETFSAHINGGVASIPAEFLTEGKYEVFIAVNGGVRMTNAIKMVVTKNGANNYAYCKEDYYELLDAVYRLMRAYYNTEKRVSDHIDGYDVI